MSYSKSKISNHEPLESATYEIIVEESELAVVSTDFLALAGSDES
jgi:hypothetical protein